MRIICVVMLLTFTTSNLLAASDKCKSLLAGFQFSTREGTRLNAAAIQHGFNIYTGEVEEVDNQSKYAKTYMNLSNKHLEEAEKLQSQIISECLK